MSEEKRKGGEKELLNSYDNKTIAKGIFEHLVGKENLSLLRQEPMLGTCNDDKINKFYFYITYLLYDNLKTSQQEVDDKWVIPELEYIYGKNFEKFSTEINNAGELSTFSIKSYLG